MLKSWLKLFFLALIWGSSFILIKRGLFAADGSVIFNGLQVGSLRIILAGVALLPISIPLLKTIKKREIAPLIFAGVLGNGMPALLFAMAQTKVASSVTGVLNALTPIMALLIGFIFLRLKIKWLQIIGILIGLVGSAMLVLRNTTTADTGNLPEMGMILAACLCYGLNVNIIKRFMQDMPAKKITSIAFFFLLPPFIILSYLSGTLDVINNNPNALTAIGYLSILGVVGTALAVLIFNKLVQDTSPVFATSVTYLIPIVALAWGLIDQEQLFAKDAFAAILILSGVLLTNKGK